MATSTISHVSQLEPGGFASFLPLFSGPIGLNLTRVHSTKSSKQLTRSKA